MFSERAANFRKGSGQYKTNGSRIVQFGPPTLILFDRPALVASACARERRYQVENGKTMNDL